MVAGNWSRVTGAERAVASMEAEYTMLLPGRPDPKVDSPHSGWSPVAPPTHLWTNRRRPPDCVQVLKIQVQVANVVLIIKCPN